MKVVKIVIFFRKMILFIVIYACVFSQGIAQSETPRKLLFIGNSYTYFWNLPQQLAAMAESKQISLATRQSTAGGVSLAQHWRGEKKLQSLEKIRKGDFDAVVIQDHSLSAVESPDSLLHYGQLFGKEIQAKGAQIYVYMTWARPYDPYTQKQITDKYNELAKILKAQIVPVGLAWQRARALRPEITLYDPDQSHPSPEGSYLSACVFFRVITGESPIGLPNRLTSTDQDGEKIYLNILSPEDALFFQKVAEEVVTQTNN